MHAPLVRPLTTAVASTTVKDEVNPRARKIPAVRAVPIPASSRRDTRSDKNPPTPACEWRNAQM